MSERPSTGNCGQYRKKWVLPLKDYIAGELIADDILPRGGLVPAYWTKDESYLFFSSYIAFDGGGTCFNGFGSQGLFRINLHTGTISTILPESFHGEYEIAFSPNGRLLAYSSQSRNPVILDLKTGEEYQPQTGNDDVGGFVWSPDGTEIAFGTCWPTQDYLRIAKSSIKIYSLEFHSTRTLMEVEGEFLQVVTGRKPIHWKSSNSMSRPLLPHIMYMIGIRWKLARLSQQPPRTKYLIRIFFV